MKSSLPEFTEKPLEKGSRTGTIFLLCIALIVVTLSVYMQVGNHPFLNLDDGDYVTNNPHVTSGITGRNILWAFTSVHSSNWHPITWLSHMADVQFHGMNPRGHHLTNVAIHIVSALLLLFLLHRLTGALWQSFFVTALFALHPLHVESVAWVAERKDVLSAFFWFLTLLFYAEYVAKQKPWLYILSLFSFVLGLMSKPMLVTLPIIMLLLDLWPLGRYRHEERQGLRQLSNTAITLIKEKIPFLFCSLLSGVVTIYAQHEGGAVASLTQVYFGLRIENALISYAKYIGKTLWPRDLAVLYPLTLAIPVWQVIISLFILSLFSALAVRSVRSHPYFAAGWFWFIITLVPVIGLIQVGSQSMADRYSYIPVTGLFIMAAWGIPDLTRGLRRRQGMLVLFAGAVIFSSALLTWQQLVYWRDSISLYQHALQGTTDNYLIHYHLGRALKDEGRLDEAITQFQKALQITPDCPLSHAGLGDSFFSKGNLDAAIHEYHEALRIDPNEVAVHYNLGRALKDKGSLDEAIQEYRETLRTNPDHPKVHNSLGIALSGKGDLDAAIHEYREALRKNPNDVDAHYNLGLDLAGRGDLDAAIREYREALRLSPSHTNALYNMGIALDLKWTQDKAGK